MPDKSYYEVLGVAPSADADEIRSAYRRLARELHPDVNPSKDAASRFASVGQAYDVLSDPDKRARYDRYGRADVGPSSAPWEQAGVGFDDLGSVFDSFFGGARQQHAPGRRPQANRTPDAAHEIHIAFVTMARGGQHPLTVERSGKRREIQVAVPPGTRDGSKLRVRGEGHALPGRPGKRSDLILTVRVVPHAGGLRRGDPGRGEREGDVFAHVSIDIATATLGGTTEVQAIDGRLEVTVPPGSASGKILRLRGQGIGPQDGTRGDLHVVLGIVPPDPELMDDDDRAELRRLASVGASDRTRGRVGE
ncbi:MAG: DnaJ C-terminal domain-containing protein [Planctomycetota bacterium]